MPEIPPAGVADPPDRWENPARARLLLLSAGRAPQSPGEPLWLEEKPPRFKEILLEPGRIPRKDRWALPDQEKPPAVVEDSARSGILPFQTRAATAFGTSNRSYGCNPRPQGLSPAAPR